MAILLTRRFGGLLSILVVTAVSSTTALARPSGDDPVIAQVGTETVTASAFLNAFGGLPPETKRRAETDQAALVQLVRGELGRRAVLSEARARHWDRKPEIAAQAEHAAEDVIITSFLDATEVPTASFPSVDAARQVYLANLSRFMMPRLYHLAQIYVVRPSTGKPDDINTARQRAAGLAQSAAAANADFSALARTSSDDHVSAPHGGDLGWLSEKDLIPEIAKVVSGMANGEVSGAVEVSDGWHILLLSGTKPPAPQAFDTVRPAIVTALRQEETARLERAHIDTLLDQGHAEADIDQIREILARQAAPRP